MSGYGPEAGSRPNCQDRVDVSPPNAGLPDLEVQVDASTVIAVCSVVVAGASLAVSAYVARATRKHNRLSVQPVLGFRTAYSADDLSGLLLINSGLGPARIIESKLTYDGVQFGPFSESSVNEFRRYLKEHDRSVRPHATTLGGQQVLGTDYRQFLLGIGPKDLSGLDKFRELDKFRQVIDGLKLEIEYESIYGGEGLTAVHPNPLREVTAPSAEADHDQVTQPHARGEPTLSSDP